MIDILFVTAAIGYGVGGSEKALIEMLKKLDKKKYKITVLSLNEKTEYPFECDGVDVIYGYDDWIHICRSIMYIVLHLNQYKFCEVLTRIYMAMHRRFSHVNDDPLQWEMYKPFLRKYEKQFDVVIGYGVDTATFFAIDKCNAKKKILWANTDLEKAGTDIKYGERFYRSADRIVVDSESGIQRMGAVYPELKDKIVSIRNILNAEELIQKADEDEGFTDNIEGKRILSVGRLAEAKAFDIAIEAASILKDRGYKFKWYIIGFGGLEDKLKKLSDDLNVSDIVVFLGQKYNPYPFFKQTDIYVQTSIFEGSCITLEEAMAFKKPVVTTNFPAAFEKVVDGQNGFITNMNGRDVAEAVEKIIVDDQLYKNMEKYQMENPLRYDKEIDKFDNLITELLN